MDDCIIHVDSQYRAMVIMKALKQSLRECGLQRYPTKTKLMHWRDSSRKKKGDFNMSFDFLGYAFRPRLARNSQRGKWFTNWPLAVSNKSKKLMSDKLSQCASMWNPTSSLQDIARQFKPLLTEWLHYYGKFYVTKLKEFTHLVNVKVTSWARRKYKNLRPSLMEAMKWLHWIWVRSPELLAYWSLLDRRRANG
jgi:RNA-directed DNA polymerase